MKIALLSFDCDNCGKHNDLPIPWEKLVEHVENGKKVACEYCGAKSEIPQHIKEEV